jgi:predicted glycosyltransferase/VanZ family protein
MNILFHINHPAQFHLFKDVIHQLNKSGHIIQVIARDKDVLLQLLENEKISFLNVTHRTDRKSNIFSLFINLIIQYRIVKKCCKNFEPDIMIGTSFILPLVSWKLKVPFLNFLEDDAQVDPLYVRLSLPLSTEIIAPSVCQLGRFESKKIGYKGYHELAFLHPDLFTPSRIIAQNYINLEGNIFLLRFTAFNAYHDYGKRGLDLKMARKIIKYLEQFGEVIISSEKPLDSNFEKYRLLIKPNDIHHVMAHCSIIIGDSQSMAMEAACLGIPSIRLNDFAGRISVLEELEKRYQLTHGYSVKNKDAFFDKIKSLVEDSATPNVYQARKNIMIQDKINVRKFIFWLINDYPESIEKYHDQEFMLKQFGGSSAKPITFDLIKGTNQKYIWLFIIYFLSLLVLYITPLDGGLRLNRYNYSGFRLDHIIHFLVFIPTAFIIAPIFLRQTQFRIIKIVVLSITLAVLFETTHLFVTYRAFTIADLLSNLIGVTIGSILFITFKNRSR